MSLKQNVHRFLRGEDGAELAEYAVGVALLVAIGLVVYKILGNSINDSETGTAAKVKDASDYTYP
jgi:Flp pilus assembly pilin Flp